MKLRPLSNYNYISPNVTYLTSISHCPAMTLKLLFNP